MAARRLSVQSERNSFSDVDSPMSATVVEAPKPEITIADGAASAESSSPLLSSLLKSPTALPPVAAPAALPLAEAEAAVDVDVVDEPMESSEAVDGVAVDAVVVKPSEVESKPDENVEELLAAAVDEVSEKMPELLSILAGAENAAAPAQAVDDQAGEEVSQLPAAEVKAIKEEPEPETMETKELVPKPEKVETEADQPAVETEIVEEAKPAVVDGAADENDESANDSLNVENEDKPLEGKRTSRTGATSKTTTSSRPSRKASEASEDAGGDEGPGRRETRSKKTSERSDEAAANSTELASEESPLPPAALPTHPGGARETRRSATKKSGTAESEAAADEPVASKDKEETVMTPQSAPENRRLVRIKEKETSGRILRIEQQTHFQRLQVPTEKWRPFADTCEQRV
jgi:hypothetical protein